MFTLHTDAKFDDTERLIDKITRLGNAQTRAIADGIKQQHQANFTRQGSGNGAWRPLAPATVADRRRQGYAGNRPILVRRGDYRRSFVERGGDNHERIWQSAVGLTIESGSNDPVSELHERGTSRMPAREVVPLDDAQERALVRLIDFVIDQTEHQFWR